MKMIGFHFGRLNFWEQHDFVSDENSLNGKKENEKKKKQFEERKLVLSGEK